MTTHTPSEHTLIDYPQFQQHAPGVIAALRAMTQAVDQSGLDKGLTEIIKIRASQMNDCAFCLNFHLVLAAKHQVEQHKIDAIAAWRDSQAFSPREQLALGWTEALTRLESGAEQAIDDRTYSRMKEAFSEAEIANLTAAVACINAWNRIAGALRFSVSTKPA